MSNHCRLLPHIVNAYNTPGASEHNALTCTSGPTPRSGVGRNQLGTNASCTPLLLCQAQEERLTEEASLSLLPPCKCGLQPKVAMVPSSKPGNNAQKNFHFPFFFSLFPLQFVAEALRWTETPRHLHNGAINCDPVWADWEGVNAEHGPSSKKRHKQERPYRAHL